MENYFQIQNKLWVHKGVNPDQYLHRPYYEFQWLVEEWSEWLKKEKEAREAENQQAGKQTAEYQRQTEHFKSPDMPGLPKFDMPSL